MPIIPMSCFGRLRKSLQIHLISPGVIEPGRILVFVQNRVFVLSS